MLVVVSPESDDRRERTVLADLLAAGLVRYHVRKPGWSERRLEAWLRELPSEWRPRLVLHGYQELALRLALGGRHWPDAEAPVDPPPGAVLCSRSCHGLAALEGSLGRYDSVLFGPVFPSLSKPGYGPRGDASMDALSRLLEASRGVGRRTSVLAIGGVTAERLPAVRALGFDGAAVLGAIWQAEDPLRAFEELRRAAPAGDERWRADRAEPESGTAAAGSLRRATPRGADA